VCQKEGLLVQMPLEPPLELKEEYQRVITLQYENS